MNAFLVHTLQGYAGVELWVGMHCRDIFGSICFKLYGLIYNDPCYRLFILDISDLNIILRILISHTYPFCNNAALLLLMYFF